MTKLLRANFICLWRNIIFLWCVAFVIVAAALMALIESVGTSPDYTMFEGTTYVSMTISVFAGMFIGTEYNEGTLRNKILTGHSRWSVYFANFIVCMVVSIILYILTILTTTATAAILHWEFRMTLKELFPLILFGLLPLTAYAALFTLISMLVGKRAESLILSIFIVMVLSVASTKIDVELALFEENFAQKTFYYVDEKGEVATEVEPAEKTPDAATKAKHKVCQFLYDTLPSCQFNQIMSVPINIESKEIWSEAGYDTSYYERSRENVKKIPLYGVPFIVGILAIGGFFFQKKNLK